MQFWFFKLRLRSECEIPSSRTWRGLGIKEPKKCILPTRERSPQTSKTRICHSGLNLNYSSKNQKYTHLLRVCLMIGLNRRKTVLPLGKVNTEPRLFCKPAPHVILSLYLPIIFNFIITFVCVCSNDQIIDLSTYKPFILTLY